MAPISNTHAVQQRIRSENPLDALLDELQTFTKPSSAQTSRRSSADTDAIISDGYGCSSTDFEESSQLYSTEALEKSIAKCPDRLEKQSCEQADKSKVYTIDSDDAMKEEPTEKRRNSIIRRLPSFPSTDSQPSPIKSPSSNYFPPPNQKRNGEEQPNEKSGKESPALPPKRTRYKLPPPPPPRSSKSPLVSPAGSLSPSAGSYMQKRASTLPKTATAFSYTVPGGIVASTAGGVLRNAEGRELYGPVLKHRAPFGRYSLSEDSTTSTCSTGSTTSSDKAGQLSSLSSAESTHSQERIDTRSMYHSLPYRIENGDAAAKIKQEKLEQRHFDLLKRQKQLQEQYIRLQTLQRTGGKLDTANIDLKKTGSEGNLAAKASGSNVISSPKDTTLVSCSLSLPRRTTSLSIADSSRRNSSGVVETDIL